MEGMVKVWSRKGHLKGLGEWLMKTGKDKGIQSKEEDGMLLENLMCFKN